VLSCWSDTHGLLGRIWSFRSLTRMEKYAICGQRPISLLTRLVLPKCRILSLGASLHIATSRKVTVVCETMPIPVVPLRRYAAIYGLRGDDRLPISLRRAANPGSTRF
jgi:hypothetical protein